MNLWLHGCCCLSLCHISGIDDDIFFLLCIIVSHIFAVHHHYIYRQIATYTHIYIQHNGSQCRLYPVYLRHRLSAPIDFEFFCEISIGKCHFLFRSYGNILCLRFNSGLIWHFLDIFL